jgi:hypothetical protein
MDSRFTRCRVLPRGRTVPVNCGWFPPPWSRPKFSFGFPYVGRHTIPHSLRVQHTRQIDRQTDRQTVHSCFARTLCTYLRTYDWQRSTDTHTIMELYFEPWPDSRTVNNYVTYRGMARSPSLAGMKTFHTTDTRHLQKHLLLAVCDSNRCSVEPASQSKEVTRDYLHTEFSFGSTLHNETSLII